MGQTAFDAFSYLHWCTGSFLGFWIYETSLTVSRGFWLMMALNVGFEFFENSDAGMSFINSLPLWPGGKHIADAPVNIVTDICAVAGGYLVSRWLRDVLPFDDGSQVTEP